MGGFARRCCAALLGLMVCACSAGPTSYPPKATDEGVRFTVVVPGARSVAVAGNFNGWSPRPMRPTGSDGGWIVVIPLRPGEYEFAYLVDGHRWMEPPAADDFVSDGFGRRNGVVVVPERGMQNDER